MRLRARLLSAVGAADVSHRQLAVLACPNRNTLQHPENGEPIGLAMPVRTAHGYVVHKRRFTNVLYAVRSRTQGKVLGQRSSQQAAAYDELVPTQAELRRYCEARLKQVLGSHAAAPGSIRPPLTEEQRRSVPSVIRFSSHAPDHRRKCSTATRYAYASRARPRRSDRVLRSFEHQLQPKYSTRTPGRARRAPVGPHRYAALRHSRLTATSRD